MMTFIECLVILLALGLIAWQIVAHCSRGTKPRMVSDDQAFRKQAAEKNDHRIVWDKAGEPAEYVESEWISRRDPGTPLIYG